MYDDPDQTVKPNTSDDKIWGKKDRATIKTAVGKDT